MIVSSVGKCQHIAQQPKKKSQRTKESERENQITKYYNLFKLLIWCGCLNPATVIISNVFSLKQCLSCSVKIKTLSYGERSSSLFARSNLIISTDRMMLPASVASVTAAATDSMNHTINCCKTRMVCKTFVKYSLIPTSVHIIHVLSPFFSSFSFYFSIRTITKTMYKFVSIFILQLISVIIVVMCKIWLNKYKKLNFHQNSQS